MKPVFQTRSGRDGNCWPACLASVFEVPLEEVDQCAGGHPDWLEQTERWLAARGLFYLEHHFDTAAGISGFTKFPDGCFMIGGVQSSRGLPHAVVIQVRHGIPDSPDTDKMEFHIVHDPFGPLQDTYELDTIFFFCPIHR